jgi:hypothetical protein
MTASPDSDYGIEYYVGIAPITPETNMLADHCGLNRKLLICVMQLEKYQNIEQIAAPIAPPHSFPSIGNCSYFRNVVCRWTHSLHSLMGAVRRRLTQAV